MFKNYLYLCRAVKELNPLLINCKIEEIYSQEKNKLYFKIPSSEFPHRHLIISTDQNTPFLFLKKEHFKAKKNFVDFFSDYFPDTITEIKIALMDRIVLLELKRGKIFFIIRGNKTNVVYFSESKFFFFKKNLFTNEYLNIELFNLDFINDFILPKIETVESLDLLKKQFPFLSKEISNEIIKRNEYKNFNESVIEVFNSFVTEDISVFFSEEIQKSFFMPRSFLMVPHNSLQFNTYNEALSNYFKINFSKKNILNSKKMILNFLEKELTKLASKLNNLKSRIERGSKEEYYNNVATLLMANLNLIKKGDKVIELRDFYSNQLINIKLDPQMLPQENAEKYYSKSRDEKIDFKKSNELFYKAKEKYIRYQKILEEVQLTDEKETLNKFIKILNLKNLNKGKVNLEYKINYKHYLIDGKFHLYVGKDSKSNDLLTTKFAKQNDYWFHMRGLAGSHVVLRVENKSEVVPKSVLKTAAQIAAYHSKGKTAGTAPVSYTFAKFVYKKKGMPPGQVLIQKEKVLHVRPEIPNNAEFIED